MEGSRSCGCRGDAGCRLGSRPARGDGLLSACCAERLVGLYQVFSQARDWGDYQGVRAALDFVWSQLRGGASSAAEVESALAVVEAAAPDGELFPDLDGTVAVDGCVCVCVDVVGVSQSTGLR